MKIIYFLNCCLLFSFSTTAQNVGIGTLSPANKLHVINSTPSINTIHAVNSGTTSGTNWDQNNNFAGVHGEAAAGTTQYQAGVYGYQTGTGVNSGAVVGAYSINTWGGLGYTDGSGTRWGVYTPANLYADKIGIGVAPGYPLNFPSTVGDKISFYGTSGAHYGIGIQGSLLQLYTNINTSDIAFGYGQSSALTTNVIFKGDGKVGIGKLTPAYTIDVAGSLPRTGNFVNTAADQDYSGVYGSCRNTAGYGRGVYGNGGSIGVFGTSVYAGVGSRSGVEGVAGLGEGSNYGVVAHAVGGTAAYGVYAYSSTATINYGVYATADNWAGYFDGPTFCTNGIWSSSDRKLKNDIRPLSGALSIINQLNPSAYTFKTTEFKQMNLPGGLQYGLIADEVQQVIPGAVKKAIQPAAYENNDPHTGKKISDPIEFSAVNYTEMIPILIAAVKEQQVIITDLKKQLEEMKTAITELKMNKR